MLTGWQEIDGKKYYFGEYGNMQKGFKKIDDEWYYFSKDTGIMQKGWQTIDGKEYYFDKYTGKMQKNTEIDGKKLGDNGAVIV